MRTYLKEDERWLDWETDGGTPTLSDSEVSGHREEHVIGPTALLSQSHGLGKRMRCGAPIVRAAFQGLWTKTKTQ